MAAGTKIVFDGGDQIAGVDETSATLTVRTASTGGSLTQARRGKPVFATGARPLKLITGTISFDTSYPTNGEDISEIWKRFMATARDNSRNPTAWALLGLVFDSSVANAVGKEVIVDYANKKLKVATAFAGTEAANASDQSGLAAIPFLAWGYGT